MTKPGIFSLSLILSLSLVACGGGGGGDSAPVVPASYAPGSAELGAWEVLSKARTLCGFDGSDPLVRLTRNAKLDAAALSHSKYLVDLSFATGDSVLSHLETRGVAGFTGVYPWDRAVYQGYNYAALAEILEATVWDYTSAPTFPTMQVRGADSMRSLLNTVYHLSGAMYEGADVGFGAYLKTTMINATTWREEYRFGSLNGFEDAGRRITLGTGKVATYPCQNSSDIPPAFDPANESPNPFIGTAYANALVGPPIYLKVDAPQTITVNALSSRISRGGATVPFVVLSSSNDPNKDPVDGQPYITPNEIFVIPTVALNPDTDYEVTLNGKVGLTAFPQITFTMRTGQ
ncbi:hypothetical protein [Rhodoferax sp.]|uniref:CAP domain-containing protein n=1 Tax=Rhodoferax sp. TaxID=50421 RepID=UPI0025EEB8F3|nr:hypothetical protein [Rhodoferax sp.]